MFTCNATSTSLLCLNSLKPVSDSNSNIYYYYKPLVVVVADPESFSLRQSVVVDPGLTSSSFSTYHNRYKIYFSSQTTQFYHVDFSSIKFFTFTQLPGGVVELPPAVFSCSPLAV